MEERMKDIVSIRLQPGTLVKLKMLACQMSLKEQKEVRWTSLVREAIAKLLAEGNKHE
jgi:hypothetical protein